MKLKLFLVNLLITSTTLGFQPLEDVNSEEHPRSVVWELGNPFLSNLQTIPSELLEGRSAIQPWSGDFWSESLGSIGFRYNDPWLQKNLDKENLDFTDSERKSIKRARKQSKIVNENYKKFSVANYIEQGRINQLSPAEKYDLLIGDKKQTLSRSVIDNAIGEGYVVVDPKTGREKKYKAELWNGMCDGTSAASIIEKRPIHPVTVTGVNGHQITFYPDDLKALMSLYWFENEPEHNLLGGFKECPRRKKGKLSEGGCYSNVNPAAWHLAVINQIGSNKVPLLFDSDPSDETWNYPIMGYKLRYYDLATGLETTNFKDALARRDQLIGDEFIHFRNPKSKYLLGVLMEIHYVSGRTAQAQNFDAPSKDNIVSMTYHYDLEIDENLEIVGGEWLWSIRPDMVWMPVQDFKKTLDIEDYLGLSWDGKSPISLKSQIAASGGELDGEVIPSQSERLIPLPHIFRRLVEMAQ